MHAQCIGKVCYISTIIILKVSLLRGREMATREGAGAGAKEADALGAALGGVGGEGIGPKAGAKAPGGNGPATVHGTSTRLFAPGWSADDVPLLATATACHT